MFRGFEFQKKLGEGAYSSVYRVKRIEDDNIYALKMVKLKNLSSTERINALNEVRILASVRSPNVVAYKECFLDKSIDSLCIVMDFAQEGDLLYKIQEKQKSKTYFDESEIWNIFIQVNHFIHRTVKRASQHIVKGLKAMHDLNILHRDLKSANVFLYEKGVAKLGDFNVSKHQKQRLLLTQTGTPYYASPEVWKDEPYDRKADLWSLGCVLYEMAALKPPFRGEDMQGLFKRIVSGKYQRIPDIFSNDLVTVIGLLLQVNPSSRPSCNQILKHSIVKKYIQEKHELETEEKSMLLRTIEFQKNYTETDLPKPNYSPIKLLPKQSVHLRHVSQTSLQKTDAASTASTSPSFKSLTEASQPYDRSADFYERKRRLRRKISVHQDYEVAASHSNIQLSPPKSERPQLSQNPPEKLITSNLQSQQLIHINYPQKMKIDISNSIPTHQATSKQNQRIEFHSLEPHRDRNKSLLQVHQNQISHNKSNNHYEPLPISLNPTNNNKNKDSILAEKLSMIYYQKQRLSGNSSNPQINQQLSLNQSPESYRLQRQKSSIPNLDHPVGLDRFNYLPSSRKHSVSLIHCSAPLALSSNSASTQAIHSSSIIPSHRSYAQAESDHLPKYPSVLNDPKINSKNANPTHTTANNDDNSLSSSPPHNHSNLPSLPRISNNAPSHKTNSIASNFGSVSILSRRKVNNNNNNNMSLEHSTTSTTDAESTHHHQQNHQSTPSNNYYFQPTHHPINTQQKQQPQQIYHSNNPSNHNQSKIHLDSNSSAQSPYQRTPKTKYRSSKVPNNTVIANHLTEHTQSSKQII